MVNLSDKEYEALLQAAKAQQSSTANIAKALAAAQGAIGTVAHDREVKVPTAGGSSYSFRYATLAAIMDAVRKPLADNGLALVQIPKVSAEVVTVTTRLLHVSGESLESEVRIPLGKRDAQGVGAAITYARRYGLSSLLGIATEEENEEEVLAQPPKQAPAKPSFTEAAKKQAAKKPKLSEGPVLAFGPSKGHALSTLSVDELQAALSMGAAEVGIEEERLKEGGGEPASWLPKVRANLQEIRKALESRQQ